MILTCRQHQLDGGDHPLEVPPLQRCEELWPDSGATVLLPEREEREYVPDGQSPYEIADRERGATVTQEEATGWA